MLFSLVSLKIVGCHYFNNSITQHETNNNLPHYTISQFVSHCLWYTYHNHIRIYNNFLFFFNCLILGDTLFLGGCGRFFEGTPAQMYDALINILSQLPEETKVYCGHEYSLQNLKFAAFVEPTNVNVMKKMKWSMEQREKGLPTVRNM